MLGGNWSCFQIGYSRFLGCQEACQELGLPFDGERQCEPCRYSLEDGYTAARAIRSLENQEIASVPILAMTANAFEEDKQEALRSGMNGHISKPINIEKLLETLNEMLS